jgi:alpha-mannosidase
MWVEPDCNLPSGESICRQLALGQRYFQRAFGRSARVGFNPDSFGHAAGLPQLLAKSGITAYVLMRPGQLERPLPRHAFVWTDPSGSRVAAFRIPVDYGSESAASTVERVAEVSAMSEVDQTPLMCFFGVGNHGGGPTTSMLQALEQAMATDGRLRYSSPDAYFGELDGLRETLPVVEGELQHHAVGCYSVSAWIKAANRSSEAALLDAEVFESVARRLVERQAEQVAFGRAWEQLALCQFHDVLAGTSSESAYRTIRSRFGYVDTIADQVTTNALYEIAHHVDTRIDEVGPQERQNLWSMEQPPAAPSLSATRWPGPSPRSSRSPGARSKYSTTKDESSLARRRARGRRPCIRHTRSSPPRSRPSGTGSTGSGVAACAPSIRRPLLALPSWNVDDSASWSTRGAVPS